MAAPLVAALGVHVALAGLALSVRPRALPEVAEAPGLTLVPVIVAVGLMNAVAAMPATDAPATADPVAVGASAGADLQEAQVPQAVAGPNVLPSLPTSSVAPTVARAPARASAPLVAPGATPVATMAAAQHAGPDAEVIAAWRAALSAWVEQNRRYPPAARFRQEEGVVQVRFELGPDGRVLRVEVQRESGSASLDTAAVALLFGATLPAPPRELAPGLRVVTLPIRYRLQ